MSLGDFEVIKAKLVTVDLLSGHLLVQSQKRK